MMKTVTALLACAHLLARDIREHDAAAGSYPAKAMSELVATLRTYSASLIKSRALAEVDRRHTSLLLETQWTRFALSLLDAHRALAA